MTEQKNSPIIFSGIGADPEHLYVKNGQVIPASELAYGEYVGCDGHTRTGELRPPPSRSVHRLLLNIGHGLVTKADSLKQTQIRMHASPYYSQEPLGGHIHLSFFYQDPGMIYTMSRQCVRDPIVGDVSVYPRPRRVPTSTALNPWTAPLPGPISVALAYLLHPLELLCQPPTLRGYRNRTYGNVYDIRWDNQAARPAPKSASHADWEWTKYEYRHPSTWLYHPLIAYAYLASAKLMIYAWPYLDIQSLYHPEPQPEKFSTRLMEVLKLTQKLPPDLADLPAVAEYLPVVVKKYHAAEEIDIRAWQLLCQKGLR
jgi:hypothetical protein